MKAFIFLFLYFSRAQNGTVKRTVVGSTFPMQGTFSSSKNCVLLSEAAIAQWIRLLLPSCSPGFYPQTQNLCFFNLYLNSDDKRTKINKKKPYVKNLEVDFVFVLKNVLFND